MCADNRFIAVPAFREFDEKSRGGRLCRSTNRVQIAVKIIAISLEFQCTLNLLA
jgi:hypothetical protein